MPSDSFLREQIEIAGISNLRNFDYRPQVLKSATCQRVAQAREGRILTLVLGAGVSFPSKLPGWEELIARAGTRALEGTALAGSIDLTNVAHLPSIAQVRLLENVLGLKAAFRGHLMDSLYQDFRPGRPSRNLVEIADFVAGDGPRPKVSTVITYNFDNLLERSIEYGCQIDKCASDFVSIFSEDTFVQQHGADTIKIYHPHGYIPYDASFDYVARMPLIFSEEDYHQHYLNHTCWANTLQMMMFGSTLCLFIGLSFSDGNIRRLLDFSKGRRTTRHVAIKALQKGDAESSTPHIEDYIIEKDLESLGIETLWVRSHTQIGRALSMISKL